LTLNEAKTSVRNARQERFDFLGYTFGPHFSRRTGREYIGYSPDPDHAVMVYLSSDKQTHGTSLRARRA
jgi:hypothetical protein